MTPLSIAQVNAMLPGRELNDGEQRAACLILALERVTTLVVAFDNLEFLRRSAIGTAEFNERIASTVKRLLAGEKLKTRAIATALGMDFEILQFVCWLEARSPRLIPPSNFSQH